MGAFCVTEDSRNQYTYYLAVHSIGILSRIQSQTMMEIVMNLNFISNDEDKSKPWV